MGKRTKNIVIRRCNREGERSSASYAIPRANPIGRSVGGQYRFAKIGVDEAKHFTEDEAKRVVKSLTRIDPAPYTLVETC
jgi:hypothetical protein